jgi:hypothetical protein
MMRGALHLPTELVHFIRKQRSIFMGTRTLSNLVLAPGPDGDLVYYEGPNFWQKTGFDWKLAGPVGRAFIVLKVVLFSPILLISLAIGIGSVLPQIWKN